MRVGLALSGGAARGIAHIGVLQYLEERGVKPCRLAGTSAGSIVGALYCSGRTVEELKQIASLIHFKELIKISFPRRGLIRSSSLLKMLKQYLGDITFEELERPLVVNAVDLVKGEEVLFEKGPVAEAVAASCAIPGIFSPVRWNNRLFVDGGLLDNIPSAHIKKKDTDLVIAVNVTAQQPLEKEPDNIFEVLIQAYDIMRRQRNLPSFSCADILIEPELGDFNFWDTTRSGLLIRQGYIAAAAALADFNFQQKGYRFIRWLKKRRIKGVEVR